MKHGHTSRLSDRPQRSPRLCFSVELSILFQLQSTLWVIGPRRDPSYVNYVLSTQPNVEERSEGSISVTDFLSSEQQLPRHLKLR